MTIADQHLPRLSDATLRDVPATVATPAYDRGAVTTGIVHLGLGAFHRAHQAVYTDACLAAGERDWGIEAASLRSHAVRDALAPQDGLYALLVRDGEAEAVRVVGSLRRIHAAADAGEPLLAALVRPATRIVTLTVTERGYMIDPATGDLDEDDAALREDLAHPERPRTTLGILCEALRRRRAEGTAPFAILSCDNLAGNGRVLHRALAAYGRLRHPDDGGFFDTIRCPSTMVDRIVPATTDADRDEVWRRLGVRDAWPVVTEAFTQWVIEDDFPLGRPQWEIGGAEFVADIAPFERMKLRLLNGAHTTLAAVGRVAGVGTVAEAVGLPEAVALLRALWRDVTPTLPAGLPTGPYCERLLHRFGNRGLGHRLAQIATDASQKVAQRIVPPLAERRAAGAPAPALVFAVAAFIRSCAERDDLGRPLAPVDPALPASLRSAATDAPAEATARAFLSSLPAFAALGGAAGLAGEVAAALALIRTHGVVAAAALCLAGDAGGGVLPERQLVSLPGVPEPGEGRMP